MLEPISIIQPDNLNDADLRSCVAVIGEGSAVNINTASNELPKAMLVAIKRDGANIVGVGVIKRQRPDYAASISTKSDFKFDSQIHEIGYISVKASHRNRGISSELLKGLLTKFTQRPLFATTSHDAMKHILQGAGFTKEGKEWRGNREDSLSLWIKTT